MKKPQLGILPRKFWFSKVYTDRLVDITKATMRYLMAGQEIPKEWLEERRKILNQLDSNDRKYISTKLVESIFLGEESNKILEMLNYKKDEEEIENI